MCIVLVSNLRRNRYRTTIVSLCRGVIHPPDTARPCFTMQCEINKHDDDNSDAWTLSDHEFLWFKIIEASGVFPRSTIVIIIILYYINSPVYSTVYIILKLCTILDQVHRAIGIR